MSARNTWKRIPLHHKVLGALVLGAIFGALFNVSKYELDVVSRKAGGEITTRISHWTTCRFEKEAGTPMASFGPEDQQKILQYFRSVPEHKPTGVVLVVQLPRDSSDAAGPTTVRFEDVSSIEKVKTVAGYIKPVGTIFIRLLMFIAIPLVLTSLIVGSASLGDIRHVGRLGGKTLAWYLVTIIVSITIGLTLVNLIQPGKQVTVESRERLATEYQPEIGGEVPKMDLVDMVVNIVATNPIKALANGDMLQIVFFALMVGISLTMVPEARAKPVLDFFSGMSETMIKMVGLIMTIAPYGVFALIAATVSDFGFDILGTLFWYVLTLVVGLALQTFGFLGLAVRVMAKIPYRKFYAGMKDAMLVAFTTSSSGATLPVNMRSVEQNLGVPNKIASFVLPLGATINMDGTAMYQAVASVFIAQVYGLDLDLAQQLIILFTAVLASIGTAPVPGVGIVMLIIVLRSVNIPEEGIALILGIDRFLDMCRTVPNILGDAAVATIIARSEGLLEQRA